MLKVLLLTLVLSTPCFGVTYHRSFRGGYPAEVQLAHRQVKDAGGTTNDTAKAVKPSQNFGSFGVKSPRMVFSCSVTKGKPCSGCKSCGCTKKVIKSPCCQPTKKK